MRRVDERPRTSAQSDFEDRPKDGPLACDDQIIPAQQRMETVADDSDLEEVYNTERHLLYVACTRARDHLLVTAVSPASEFLEDLTTR